MQQEYFVRQKDQGYSREIDIVLIFSISFVVKERHRVKQLLASQEILFPNLFKSIQSALKPLLARKRTQMENKESSIDELSFLCR
jgi:hypothetical protein